MIAVAYRTKEMAWVALDFESMASRLLKADFDIGVRKERSVDLTG